MIDLRSAKANIAGAMVAKLVSMAVALVSVPLLLSLLGTHQYGVWATLTSLVAFISLLDLGVGNSLRNSVAAMSVSNDELVRTEFVGFFRLLCFVGPVAAVCFGIVVPWLEISADHAGAAWLLYVPLLLTLPLVLGASVLQGARATGLQTLLQATGGWAFFALIGLIAWSGVAPSINSLALAWSFFYLAALLVVFSLALKTLKLPWSRLLSGSISVLSGARLRVGLEFLVLQLSSLVLYGLGNVLVFDHLGASEAARYDVLNKVFQVGLSFYTIVIGVMWSEIAKSRAASDAVALTRIYGRLASIAMFFSMVCILGAVVVPTLVDVWTHHRIQVKTNEALAIAGLVSVQSLAYVGAVFMNAFEQVRLQIVLGVVSIVLMVPVASIFLNEGMGIVSVPLSAMLITVMPMILCNVHTVRLIRSVSKPEVVPR
jgi:O-antigen/teichoic acid export membrane protein